MREKFTLMGGGWRQMPVYYEKILSLELQSWQRIRMKVSHPLKTRGKRTLVKFGTVTVCPQWSKAKGKQYVLRLRSIIHDLFLEREENRTNFMSQRLVCVCTINITMQSPWKYPQAIWPLSCDLYKGAGMWDNYKNAWQNEWV